MDIRYPATVESQNDGTFLVQFVDLPDTFTEGQTKEEALFNATEVLSAMLAFRLDEAKDVPAPTGFSGPAVSVIDTRKGRPPPRSGSTTSRLSGINPSA